MLSMCRTKKSLIQKVSFGVDLANYSLHCLPKNDVRQLAQQRDILKKTLGIIATPSGNDLNV